MNDDSQPGRHAPAPDFTAYLAADLQRRMRHEARFGRRRVLPFGQVARVAAMAATIVLTLCVGLLWGVGTGFAAAQIQDGTRRAEPLPLAMVRTAPVRKALSALSCNATVAPAAQPSGAPQGVPIVDLPEPPVKTPGTFGAILGIREVPGGKVLVNDVPRRQMKLLDSTLANATIVFDSVPGSDNSYGARPLPLVRYLGDSSLTSDVSAGTLLMLGPTGQITRAVASPYVLNVPPYSNLVSMMGGRQTGVDNKGRIVFQSFPDAVRRGMTDEERVAAIGNTTVPLLRADLDTRRVDTVTMVKQGGITALMGRVGDGPVRITSMPVEIIDVFGVLSDGTVGVVRGQDYHVDWFLPDGTTRSTAKLPFDWKRLTDEEKQRMVDSARAVTATRTMRVQDPNPDAAGGGGGGGGRSSVPAGQRPPGRDVPMEYVAPALSQFPDFYPSVRMSAAIADLDGNLWILPNSSARSRNGELVYDVVNPKGDFHRVRIPVGRSIAGFGKGGVVFLQSGDRATGFHLERTRLPAARPR